MDNHVISKLRDERKGVETRIKQHAAAVYETFDKNERTCVRFGMFPADKMKQAQEHLKAEFELNDLADYCDDISRLLAVGIMDAANAGTEKVVV